VEHPSGTPSPDVGSHPPPRGNSRRGTERRTATGGLPRSEKAGPSHTRASDKNLGFKNAGHPAVRRAPRRHVDPGGAEGVPHRPAGSRSRRRPAVPEDCREDAQAMPVRRCVSRTAHASRCRQPPNWNPNFPRDARCLNGDGTAHERPYRCRLRAETVHSRISKIYGAVSEPPGARRTLPALATATLDRPAC